MTGQQRRVVYAVCVVVGITFLVSAGLTFLITPMANDLGLNDDQVDIALSLPGVGSMIVIFVAGRLGDRLGHRPIILGAGIGFVLGSMILVFARGVGMVNIGLLVCGAMATAVQVVALGLLQVTAPDGKAHASAFTTYGMVFPIAYLVVPVATGGLVDVASWRWVPFAWAVGGGLLLLVSLLVLHRPASRLPIGELWTPLLAGLSLAALLRWVGWYQSYGPLSARSIGAMVLAIASAAVCAVLLRSARRSSLSLATVRDSLMRILLLGIALVALVDTLTFITLAIESMYGLTALEAAVALVPAQVSGIIGAKLVSLWAIRHWGITIAGRVLIGALGCSTLLLLFIQSDTALPYLIVCALVVNGMGLAAVTTLNADVMGRAHEGQASAVSAFRGAASTIGATLAVFVLGDQVVAAIDSDSSVEDNSASVLDATAAALRQDGVISFFLMAIYLVVLIWVGRRYTHRDLDADYAR